MLDSMASQMAHADKSAIESVSDKFCKEAESTMELCKNAFSYVFNYIAKQEKGSGAFWRPTLTGLILTAAPIGKGGSMWVSEEGMEDFLLRGKDAVKEITLTPNVPITGIIGSV